MDTYNFHRTFRKFEIINVSLTSKLITFFYNLYNQKYFNGNQTTTTKMRNGMNSIFLLSSVLTCVAMCLYFLHMTFLSLSIFDTQMNVLCIIII